MRQIFSSFTALHNYLDATPRLEGTTEYSTALSFHGDTEWHQTRNMQQAREYAIYGWPDGAKNLASHPLLLPLANTELTWDVQGHIVDIGEYLSGNPECCLREEPTESRMITIESSGCFSSRVSPDQIFRRGRAILALIDSLSSHGADVEIVASWQTDDAYLAVTLKRFGETLDTGVLAYALANASSLRRHQFAWQERQRECFNQTKSGQYGYPKNPETTTSQIYFPANRGIFDTDDEALAWAQSIYKAAFPED